MANDPGLVHFEDSEHHPFKAARDATEVQLKMAQEIIAKAAPNQQGAASPELLAGVLQAFATNFAALVISRKMPDDED